MTNIKTKTIELPTFEQLSKENQEQVIKNYYDINVDSDYWSDDIIENFKDKLSREYSFFENIEAYFSGFWSQGDGACFDADINASEFMRWILKQEKINAKTINTVCNMIEQGQIDFNPNIYKNSYANHYCHSNTRSIEIIDISCDYIENKKLKTKYEAMLLNIVDKEQANINEWYRSLCDDLYSELKNEYKYLTSEEAIRDTIIANEYTFNSDTLRIES